MDKQSNKIIGLFARYLALFLVGMNIYFFRDKILTPLTLHTSNKILSIFSPTTVADNIIKFRGVMIEIVPACVAASAFFLLLFLILATSEIKPGKRSLVIILSMLSLFVLNILRIVLLAILTRTVYFELAHWTFWHLISTLFVVGIWFTMVKVYKIKSIPAYSDVMYLKGLIKPRKKSKRSKKHN